MGKRRACPSRKGSVNCTPGENVNERPLAALKSGARPSNAPAKEGKRTSCVKQVLKCDAALSALIGTGEATRAQIIKRIWNYVKRNKLQDSENGRIIEVDDKLAAVVGPERIKGDRMSVFRLGKHVKKHIIPFN